MEQNFKAAHAKERENVTGVASDSKEGLDHCNCSMPTILGKGLRNSCCMFRPWSMGKLCRPSWI